MKYSQAVRLGHNGLLQKIINTNLFDIREQFVWFIDYKNKKEAIIVEKLYKTNFGSIPKFLQGFFPPTKYVGYILHDRLVGENEDIQTIEVKKLPYSRWQADRILISAIRVEGAGLIECLCIYIGATLGTIFSKIKGLWKKHIDDLIN